MSVRLNLAALTDEELQALVGPERAMSLLPEISRARLTGQDVPGPSLPRTLDFQPQAERPRGAWGATPEQTRQLHACGDALVQAGAVSQGVYRLRGLEGGHHVQVYTLEPDTVATLHWQEQGEGQGLKPPHLQLLTWPRDRASGIACVLTSSAAAPTAPAYSEEIDVHQYPQAGAAELLELHRQHVLRQGKTQKLAPEQGWLRACQAAHLLNLSAWARRGLLLDKLDKPGPVQAAPASAQRP